MEELNRVLVITEKRRLKIFNKYAVLSDPENKKSKKEVPETHKAKFNKLVDELGNENVELDISTIPVTAFSGVKISRNEVTCIKWMIEAPAKVK